MSSEVEVVNQPRWEHPSNFWIAGPSKSGKTMFVRKMIRHCKWKFDPPIKKVVFVYSVWQDTYREMKKEFGSLVQWVQGLPDDPYAFFSDTPGLLIVDDMMGQMESKHKQVGKWFTQGTHHMDVSLAVLVQNIFPPNMRTSSLNAHYMILFPNPRDPSQLHRLAAQAFPGERAWFKKAIKYAQSRPYRPLVIDFNQKTGRQYKLSVDHFPEDLKESSEPFTQFILP